jgi:acetylglutamate kinase
VHDPLAVGLSGEDAGLLSASARSPELGFVGDVVGVNASILERLLAEELIPVVATIGTDTEGQAYNVNADTAAAAIAAALGAEKVVYLTDVPGLLADANDPDSLVPTVTVAGLEALLEGGSLSGGMIPKVRSCVRAVRGGVGHAHILDGRVAHALLLEVFTREGVGTMVSA